MPSRGEFSLNLFKARVDALYQADLNGRMVSTNEWDTAWHHLAIMAVEVPNEQQ